MSVPDALSQKVAYDKHCSFRETIPHIGSETAQPGSLNQCGAATIVSSLLPIAQLRLPTYATNGKSIEVDDTDAEGHLILADSLCYASTKFKLQTVIDVATLTGCVALLHWVVLDGAMDIALGWDILRYLHDLRCPLEPSAAGVNEYNCF